jgi:hypothetical protein
MFSALLVTRRAIITIAISLTTLFPVAAFAADYHGTLAQPGVVWITDGSKPPSMPETVMTNSHKSFIPNLAVITAGSNVRFPNDDPFFHSIYSASRLNAFDLGFYDTGPGKVVPFEHSSVVEVHCHIHGFMAATIVVVNGPWAQTTAPGQTYILRNVRPGKHLLHVWTHGQGHKASTVTI